jgi:ABC-type polysaccharide/polyol phosphate export permease
VTATASAETDPLGPLVNPGRVGGLADVFRRRYLLKLLVRKELRVRYQNSPIGFAWSYIKPAVRFIMYFWIIGLLLGPRAMENRPLHIFSGMIMVTFFSNALSAGTKSVVKNKSLVRKINLPREMFPVASIAVSVYHMIPMYVIAFFGCLIYGWHPTLGSFVALAMAFAIIMVWGLGVALLLSAMNVYFRDLSNIVDVLTTVLTWTTPMIYPFHIVKDRLAGTWIYEVYLASPLSNAVLLDDRAIWLPTISHQSEGAAQELPSHLFERGLLMLAIGLVFLWVSQRVFTRLESRFAERL